MFFLTQIMYCDYDLHFFYIIHNSFFFLHVFMSLLFFFCAAYTWIYVENVKKFKLAFCGICEQSLTCSKS